MLFSSSSFSSSSSASSFSSIFQEKKISRRRIWNFKQREVASLIVMVCRLIEWFHIFSKFHFHFTSRHVMPKFLVYRIDFSYFFFKLRYIVNRFCSFLCFDVNNLHMWSDLRMILVFSLVISVWGNTTMKHSNETTLNLELCNILRYASVFTSNFPMNAWTWGREAEVINCEILAQCFPNDKLTRVAFLFDIQTKKGNRENLLIFFKRLLWFNSHCSFRNCSLYEENIMMVFCCF